MLSEATVKRISQFQSAKGAAFVITTAVMLWFLIRNVVQQIHRSQTALELSEDRFRRLVEFAPNGIFVHLNGRILYANDAMARILGYDKPTELIGMQNLEMIHPDDQPIIRERMRIIREQRIPVGLQEQRMMRKDGTYTWVEAAALPFDVDGAPGTQVFLLDISARKKAEDELRQLNETLEKRVVDRTAELQQAMEDLRTFSYMISHDLRTPLRSIQRFAEEVLSTATVQSEPAAEDASRRIVAASARLDRLIEDLFEYSKLARAEIQLQQISLVLVVHDVVGQLARDPECASAQITVREPMPWVRAHRATLALVIQNLIHNGIKYVPAGVKPVVSIQAEQAGDAGEMVRLTIEDNGVGIDRARAAAVFHLFEQPHRSSDTGGTGIGMAIVRRGVERMGGRVGVESTQGIGSKFWIELPLDPDSPKYPT